ncbi:MAG: DUF1857 family protein [Zoogloeaceae bacterium]|jgi:hypothetical protein|nr:DUF1857 family protein [Zoogloeaceae bacterium]
MQFEHILPVNDPAMPDLPRLTRRGLWWGLWQRVEHPELFLAGLTEARILSSTPEEITRQLTFGEGETAAHVTDRVRFAPEEWLSFTTEPTAQHAGGSLTISLEENGTTPLSLRFHYLTTFDPTGEAAPYAACLKAAYRDSDLETLSVIRRLLAEAGH